MLIFFIKQFTKKPFTKLSFARGATFAFFQLFLLETVAGGCKLFFGSRSSKSSEPLGGLQSSTSALTCCVKEHWSARLGVIDWLVILSSNSV